MTHGPTHPGSVDGDIMARARADNVDPVEEHRALTRLQAKMFGARPTAVEVGRYRLRSRLGAGGMGIVYEAEDPALSRRIAVKLVRASLADAQRAIVEARALAAVSAPNVVPVFDAGITQLETGEHAAFIAMQKIDGPTLAQWLDGTRTWRDVLRRFVAAGRGLAAAHRHGVVHGDFKPANVLLHRGSRPMVCDFGLARIRGDAGNAGRVGGTPGYIAPELLDGGEPNASSDQFAFCVAVHRALATAAAGQALPSAAPPATVTFTSLPPEIPGAIDDILRRGFDGDPASRWSSMNALLRALRQGRRRPWYRRPWLYLAAATGAAAFAIPSWRDPCQDAAAAQAKLRADLDGLPMLTPERDGVVASDRLGERVDVIEEVTAEVCRAADPSAATLSCLARARTELRQLLRRLHKRPSAHAALRALTSAIAPPACVDASAESEEEASPEAQEIHDLISASVMAEHVADFDDSQGLADEALARAQSLGTAAVLGPAHVRVADHAYNRGDWDLAMKHIEPGYEAALAAGNVDLALGAASKALLISANNSNGDWTRWQRHAEALLEQTDSLRPRALLALRLSQVYEATGDMTQALRQADRAAEVVAQMAADPATADPDLDLRAQRLRGLCMRRIGKLSEAEAIMRSALATEEELYGADGFTVVPFRNQLAEVLRAKGDYEGALALIEHNARVERETLPPGHPDRIGSLAQTAGLLRDLDRHEEAAAAMRAAEAEMPDDAPVMLQAAVFTTHGSLHTSLENYPGALREYTRARILLEGQGAQHWSARVGVVLNLVEIHRVQHDVAAAIPELQRVADEICAHTDEGKCSRAGALVEAVKLDDDAAEERIYEAVIALRDLTPGM